MVIVINKLDFKKLKTLYLSHNNIENINIFKKVKFNELEYLFLYNNKIIIY